MKKLGMLMAFAPALAIAGPIHVQAQTAATCESAYAENLASCDGDTRCQRAVASIYQRCKETGVIEYI